MQIELTTKNNYLGSGTIVAVAPGGPQQEFVFTVLVGVPGTVNVISIGTANPKAKELHELACLACKNRWLVWWDWLTPGAGMEARSIMVLGE